MVDWLESMSQTFEYYVVDPNTWKDVKKLNNVKSCTITRDADADTLGAATIDITESVGECYIRVYLVTVQNGVTEKHPLGTFLVQTPSSDYDGRLRNVSMDAYTPLLELKEKQPPLGYFTGKNENIMDHVYRLTREGVRAPVVKTNCTDTLYSDFVADPDETLLSYNIGLMSNARYGYDLDELGRILFAPKQEIASLQSVWDYIDDEKSILHPELTMNHDLYDIPNVVEVVYSNGEDSYDARVVNNDPNSPTSTISRGREIIHRVTNPDMPGIPTDNQIREYAERLLMELSTLEYTMRYTHGYNPVRLNDCVRLTYSRAGLEGIKAKVIRQSIKCEPGCPVSETAVFTTKLWR